MQVLFWGFIVFLVQQIYSLIKNIFLLFGYNLEKATSKGMLRKIFDLFERVEEFFLKFGMKLKVAKQVFQRIGFPLSSQPKIHPFTQGVHINIML